MCFLTCAACVAQDELVPYKKMAYRAARQVDAHFEALYGENKVEHMSQEYLWRHQLLLNAQKRLLFWSQKCGSPTS